VASILGTYAQKGLKYVTKARLIAPKTDRIPFIQLEIIDKVMPTHGFFAPFVCFSAAETEFSAHAIALRRVPSGKHPQTPFL
jgi:hypothetical protein